MFTRREVINFIFWFSLAGFFNKWIALANVGVALILIGIEYWKESEDAD